jgi:hypothetical protein
VVAGREQPGHHVPANEPGPTQHKHLHATTVAGHRPRENQGSRTAYGHPHLMG